MTDVGFRGISDPPGLEICDLVTKRQCTLKTPAKPDPVRVDPDRFPFPVETACRITTTRVTIDDTLGFVRDPSGTLVHSLKQDDSEHFPGGDYFVELSPTVKTYLHTSTAMDGTADAEGVRLSFGEPSAITVGSRAHRQRPTETVTTTPDLDDLRQAVETLSSALWTTSPERAYPSLRGHPPRIELGDSLSIPEAARPAASDIAIQVRPALSDLLVAAPLSAYLGAGLTFGEQPKIVTADGFEYQLSTETFDAAVKRVLGHVFLLDCLTRTHGLYPLDLVEYEQYADEYSLDFPELYDASPAERLTAYLSVSSERMASGPRWPAIAYVESQTDAIEILPYLVNDLTPIRTEPADTYVGDEARSIALSRFVGRPENTRGLSAALSGRERLVDVPDTDACHQIWVGEGIPLNANKLVAAAFENRFDREPSADHDVRVSVICNDLKMAEEADTVEEQYSSSVSESLDITLYDTVTTGQLTDLLGRDTEFLHYVGHATEQGLECSDGFLDITDVRTVRVDAFLLNACQSYRQGRALVDRGAIGGIVTLGDVSHDAAVKTGVAIARLLNGGFALADSLSIARRRSIVGGQYTVVGDTNATVAQHTVPVGNVARIETAANGYHFWYEGFTTREFGLGSHATVKIPGKWRDVLLGNVVGPLHLTVDELVEFLSLQSIPVWLDGDFWWSGDLTREILQADGSD